ncbi:MAG: SRPBCC domain-containing protein [Steroidobacteraceae bacterium]|nr:SRPBCC domain-containing protein [Steroidobacteraceae bacterium]
MTSRDYTTTIQVDATPDEVFDAINDVRGWWAGEIEGETAQVGAEFTYRYENFHTSKQRVIELVPGKKVVWRVLESQLNFVEHKDEWNGTRVEFEIAGKGVKAEIRFAHVGLVPEQECFEACSNAWGFLIKTSLRAFIETGKGALKLDV